jgi:AraC-like DNA-binding protein
MIEILDGIRETVNFAENSKVLLYCNNEYEDYPLHWHTACEIIMPLENGYTVWVNNTTYTLGEGDILLISPGVLHQLFAPPSGKRLIFQGDLSVLHTLKGLESALSFQPVILVTPENSPDIHSEIQSQMSAIMAEYCSDHQLKEANIYSMLIYIYVLLGRKYINGENLFQEVRSTKQQEYVEKFLFVCDYITQHCTENLTLEDVASVAGFSKFHFTRLFRQFTNLSFYDYLCKARVKYAETLLISPDISIIEVAMKSGFNSHSTFNRLFKKIKNCTPTEFRNLQGLKGGL